MRVIYFVLFLSLLSCRSDFGKKTSVFESFEFSNSSGVLPYRILLPINYDTAKSYPLVLVLHGAGERGNDNVAQLTHGSKFVFKKGGTRKVSGHCCISPMS